MGRQSCIFCGSPANSGEHLLPEWLQRILPSDEPVIHTREVDGVENKFWVKKPFREQIWAVCDGCNKGWMSRLENEAKPFLAPAITRSGQCEFDLEAQWIAARWASKTCFVFQAQAPVMLAPSTHPVLLRENGKPPQQVSVWLGSHARAKDDPINSVCIQKPLTLRLPNDQGLKRPVDFGYVCFLAVGGVSFLIVGHRFGNYVECALGQKGEHPAGEMFTKIWPFSSKIVRWPPYLMMDRELLDMIFEPNTLPPGFDARVFAGRHHEAPFRDAY